MPLIWLMDSASGNYSKMTKSRRCCCEALLHG